MKRREDCKHETLMFGSGDYYIFCKDCQHSWVTRGIINDEVDPAYANLGVGAQLSGELRVVQQIGKT